MNVTVYRWIDRHDVVIPKYLEYEIGYPDAPYIEGTEYNDIYWLRIPYIDMYHVLLESAGHHNVDISIDIR